MIGEGEGDIKYVLGRVSNRVCVCLIDRSCVFERERERVREIERKNRGSVIMEESQ